MDPLITQLVIELNLCMLEKQVEYFIPDGFANIQQTPNRVGRVTHFVTHFVLLSHRQQLLPSDREWD